MYNVVKLDIFGGYFQTLCLSKFSSLINFFISGYRQLCGWTRPNQRTRNQRVNCEQHFRGGRQPSRHGKLHVRSTSFGRQYIRQSSCFSRRWVEEGVQVNWEQKQCLFSKNRHMWYAQDWSMRRDQVKGHEHPHQIGDDDYLVPSNVRIPEWV